MIKFLGRFFKTTTYKINEKLKIEDSKNFFKNLSSRYIKKYKNMMIITAKKIKKLMKWIIL